MKAFNEKYEFVDKKSNKATNDIEKAKLDEGGFSNIYKIRDKKVKTEFVLKKSRKGNSNAPYIIQTNLSKKAFENEINNLIKVKGPNILNLIDYYFDEKEKVYYLILEKMDGNLNDLLKKNKNKMSSNLIRKIFSQVNAGLKILRQNKITHRDLKPENILFSYIGDNKTDFIIKIGDFGLSKVLNASKNATTSAGTDYFKAPEVETGKYTNKCDLYSIGIILYVLKMGEYIFEGQTWFDIKKNKDAYNIKKYTDDSILNNLIKNLVVEESKRIEWEDYFNDPFFKANDNDINKLNNKENNQNESNF